MPMHLSVCGVQVPGQGLASGGVIALPVVIQSTRLHVLLQHLLTAHSVCQSDVWLVKQRNQRHERGHSSPSMGPF